LNAEQSVPAVEWDAGKKKEVVMKIAICSSDGRNVNEHFGRTETFYIYKFEDNKAVFLEKRKTSKYSPGEPDHKFDKENFETVVDLIKDCKIVYSSKIGDIPALKLKEKGISPIKYEGRIEGLFRKMERNNEET